MGLDISDEELIQIIQAFNSNEVAFMLVGGFAVNFYGYSRTTADFDLWIQPDNVNKTRVLSAMIVMGYTEDELLELSLNDFSQPVTFQIGGNNFYIDIMTRITGVSFEEAYPASVELKVGSTDYMRVIHRNHLIVNKLLTGRLKDKLDVESLEEIRRRENNS